MAGYVTTEDIKNATGVRPEDFKLATAADLDALLDRWSGYVKGEIDDHADTDFLADAGGTLADVADTIKSVAERALSRWITQVRSHRDSAMIRLDDWRVAIDLVDEVLPKHLRDTIDRHLGSQRRGRFGFGAFVSRHGDEDPLDGG